MARATLESIKSKTPKSFQEMGDPTHIMYEGLIIRTETGDMETLALFTVGIISLIFYIDISRSSMTASIPA